MYSATTKPFYLVTGGNPGYSVIIGDGDILWGRAVPTRTSYHHNLSFYLIVIDSSRDPGRRVMYGVHLNRISRQEPKFDRRLWKEFGYKIA